jgi:hypothetical protein
MATNGMPAPDQGQGGTPPGGPPSPPPPPQGGSPDGGQQGPPSGNDANKLQKLLANWYQVAKQMAAADPRLASGAEKVSQGIQEMQTALVTPPQPTPVGQQPQY